MPAPNTRSNGGRGQTRFNCRLLSLALGGRPFGSGATRRRGALATCRLATVAQAARTVYGQRAVGADSSSTG